PVDRTRRGRATGGAGSGFAASTCSIDGAASTRAGSGAAAEGGKCDGLASSRVPLAWADSTPTAGAALVAPASATLGEDGGFTNKLRRDWSQSSSGSFSIL